MDPQILAMMMMMGFDPTGSNKSVNLAQDVTGGSLMNPMWGMLTGTYDPMLLVPQSTAPSLDQAAPFTFRYANSTGTMSDIARGVLENMTRTDARTMLKNAIADQNSDVAGQDINDLMSDVDAMFDEIKDYNDAANKAAVADAQAMQDNPYAKAGLPSPFEQWSAETVPSSEKDAAWAAAQQRAKSGLAAKARELGLTIDPETGAVSMEDAPMVERQVVGRRGSPSGKGGNPPAKKTTEQSDAGRFFGAIGEALKPAAEGAAGVANWLGNRIEGGFMYPSQKLAEFTYNKPIGGKTTSAEESAMWKTIDPKFLAKKEAYEKEAKKSALAGQMAQANREGRALGMNLFGKSPTDSALAERMAMLFQLSQYM